MQGAASVVAANIPYTALNNSSLVANRNKLRARVMAAQALLRTFEVPPDGMRAFAAPMKAALKYQFKGV